MEAARGQVYTAAMRVPFTKMHGAGNDFVVIDQAAAPSLTAHQVAAVSDRHTGIGCDQLIVIGPSVAGADATMTIYNADGSQSGACGNATRCVADLLHRRSGLRRATIRTDAGILSSTVLEDGRVEVDMGPPRLDWHDIPLSRAMDTLHLDLPGDPAAASMGNPHITFFGYAADAAAELGPRWEVDPLFPERANVGFAQVLGPARIRLRVWERGAGLTRACGSGACAAVVNAHRRGLTGREVAVVLDGGTLEIKWLTTGTVLMAGPVATAYEGAFETSDYSGKAWNTTA